MAKYIVVAPFVDLKDGNHVYGVGDSFPCSDISVSLDRITELSGSDNKLGHPLIKVVEYDTRTLEEASAEDTKPLTETRTYTKTEIARMPKRELLSLANEVGISGYEKMNGQDIKRSLISHFEL